MPYNYCNKRYFKKIKFIADISDSIQSDCKNTKRISYNYKIQNGISKQFIALDILKSKFLDDLDIIEKAMSIKNKLLLV